MRSFPLLILGFLLATLGCNTQTGLVPTETIVAESSNRDFGLTGTWNMTPDADLGDEVGNFQIVIERNGSYTATATDPTGEIDAKFVCEFRAYEISKDHPHAIIDLEVKEGWVTPLRRLFVVATKDDHLHIWPIDGHKIGEHLYDDGVSAVIEHATFSSTVRCDPKKLLKSISDHSADILGSPATYKRTAKNGG